MDQVSDPARRICAFCDKWAAVTAAQHATRMHNMRSMPEVPPHPCPQCGGTYWATKPPPEEKKERDWSAVLGAAVAVAVAAILIWLGVALVARAEEAMPYPTRDGNCPSGYYRSGTYCTPVNRDARPAVPRPSGGSCPSGWYASGNGCVRTNR